MVKKGYELIKIILDSNFYDPYYFIVKTKEKYDVVKEIIGFSSKWSIGEIENVGAFDDGLNNFIKKKKLNVQEYKIEEFIE
jgi:hypothetical protein